MLNNEVMEDIAMEIIANAGAAKSAAFKAMQEAGNGNFEAADRTLQESQQYALASQTSHTKLLTMDANGEVPGLDILMTHAQDHFMSATLAADMAEEIVKIYKSLFELKSKN